MKSPLRNLLVFLLGAAFCCANAAAQSSTPGGIEFVASVKPAGGAAEPVRQLSFYLLTRSLSDIRQQVQRADAAPDMDSFIDGLSFSPELKAWMKKRHIVNLAGSDFVKQVTPDDVIGVSEFLTAYKSQNGASFGGAIPEPKFSPADQQKNDEKYQRAHAKYLQAMRGYIAANLDSLDGLDAALAAINPGRRWAQLEMEHRQRTERRAFELAQTQYLAAKADSNINGRVSFPGLAAGSYWITTLDAPALAGDLRLLWDVPVTVRPGETTRLELSNVNALDPAESAAR